MARSVELIEGLSGRRPTGYRAPSGELTEATIDLLVEHGLTYDSSLMGHDHQPYAVRHGDRFPGGRAGAVGRTDGNRRAAVELEQRRLRVPRVRRLPPQHHAGPAPGRPTCSTSSTGDLRWMTANVDHGTYTAVFHPQVIGARPSVAGPRGMARRRHRRAALATFARLDDIAVAHLAGRCFGIEPRPAT